MIKAFEDNIPTDEIQLYKLMHMKCVSFNLMKSGTPEQRAYMHEIAKDIERMGVLR